MLSADFDNILSKLKFSSKVTLSAMLPIAWIGTLKVWISAEQRKGSCGAMFRSTNIKLSS